MTTRGDLSPEYVEARRVLLDALDALGPQSAAVVLAGAQAIYLRTGPASLPIAEHTTDGDLAVDPTLLDDAPALGDLMEAGGFKLAELGGAEEPGIWHVPATVNGRKVMIPVDLIVPAGVAPPSGSRGARLMGHGKRAARKTVGLEAALIDNDAMLIEALDPADPRSTRMPVAGTAALLVAKTHKLDDRVKERREDRLDDKDASDVVRLLQTSSPAAIAKTLSGLLSIRVPDHRPSSPLSASGSCSAGERESVSRWRRAPCAERFRPNECRRSAWPTATSYTAILRVHKRPPTCYSGGECLRLPNRSRAA